jgi:hypothetical protein
LSTVKDTEDEVPGYNVLAAAPCSVTAELLPTVAVAVPLPVLVKYAIAAAATIKRETIPAGISTRFCMTKLRMKRISLR